MAEIVPTNLREANAFVRQHHRHSGTTRGHKFSVGLADAGILVGVAIAGRPVARHRDDGLTIEVLRVCVKPWAPRNACSTLYGACCRAAKAMGYRRAITYTLRAEPGSSLKAAGFGVLGEVAARSWNTPSRPRNDRHPLRERRCWGRDLVAVHGVSPVASTVGSPGASPVAINRPDKATPPHRTADCGRSNLPTTPHHSGVGT